MSSSSSLYLLVPSRALALDEEIKSNAGRAGLIMTRYSIGEILNTLRTHKLDVLMSTETEIADRSGSDGTAATRQQAIICCSSLAIPWDYQLITRDFSLFTHRFSLLIFNSGSVAVKICDPTRLYAHGESTGRIDGATVFWKFWRLHERLPQFPIISHMIRLEV